jgi:hypothetical protein
LELAIKRHVTAALNGDVGCAAMLLKMRAHAKTFGDTGPVIVRVVNSLPPFRYQVDDDKDPQGAGSPWHLPPASQLPGPNAIISNPAVRL